VAKLPADELAALGDEFLSCTPGIVCELGNKKNVTGLYRDWYTSRGWSYVCLDWNGLDGAIPWDFRKPIPPWDIAQIGGPFQWVTNFGFTEHVYDQYECWRNVNALVAMGGLLCSCMPQLPYWKGHGIWQPEIDWYIAFAGLNGYEIEELVEWDRKRPTVVSRMRKVVEVDFEMPQGGIRDARR
jgi:hypothetical protein